MGETSIRFSRGAVVWKSISNDGINLDVSEAVYKTFLKKWLQTIKIWSHKFHILGLEIPTLFGNWIWRPMVPFHLLSWISPNVLEIDWEALNLTTFLDPFAVSATWG